LKWVASHGNEFGADGSRIVIAGNSVGGNMTAVLTMLAKERSGPATDAGVDTASYHKFATGRFLARDFMKFGWDIYARKPNSEPIRTFLRCAQRRSNCEVFRLPWRRRKRTTCSAMKAKPMLVVCGIICRRF